MRRVLALVVLCPTAAWADVAPVPDCGCAAGADPVATGLLLAVAALLALGRRRG